MRKGRPRAFDRDTALAAALRLFWERGYEGASIAELTRVMGINAPALYSAFQSKEALYLQALDLYQVREGGFTPTALAEERTAFAAIARVLHEAADAFTGKPDPTGCMISTAVLHSAPENNAVGVRVADLRRGARAALASRLTEGVREGELRPDTDIEALAAFFAATIQGLSVQARDGAPRDLLNRIADTALKAWPEQN